MAKNFVMVVGVMNFVDELVNVDCVEGFDHVDWGFFFVEASKCGVVDLV